MNSSCEIGRLVYSSRVLPANGAAGTIRMIAKIRGMTWALGSSKSNAMVRSSMTRMPSQSSDSSATTAADPLIGASCPPMFDPALVLSPVLYVKATSAAVTGVPSCQVAPSTRWNV
jgi:hypothetical protein